MEEQLQKIQRQLKIQGVYTVLVTLILGGVMMASFKNNTDFDVIRAKGLIIVDSAGNERIIMGAPVPYAHNRVRTDLKRVSEVWGKRMSPQYMAWYKKYNNSTNGMIILDENGFDKVAVGDAVPDPNIGKRIGPESGMIINDEQGFERSGYGLLNVGGQNRMVLGLDRQNGIEGLTLSIMEDESAGLSIMHKKNFLFLGNSPKDGLPVEMKDDLFGLAITDTSKIKYHFNALK